MKEAHGIPATDSPATPATRTVRPRSAWLTAARAGWVVLTLATLALFLAGLPAGMARVQRSLGDRALLDLNLTADQLLAVIAGIILVVVVGHMLIAALIFWRRPDDWMALFVATALATNGAVIPLNFQYELSAAPAELHLAVEGVIALGLISSVTLLYIFPNGRFVPGWTRLLTFVWGVLSLLTVFSPNTGISMLRWPLPFKVLALSLWSGMGVYAQLYRYFNVSGPVQRQQTKWALVGLVAAVFGPAIMLLGAGSFSSSPQVSNLLYQRMGASFFTFSVLYRTIGFISLQVATLVFPLSFAIAILRYRLWDIDVIINRTLVYGSLTGVLLLLYGISVLIFSGLLRALTGQGQFGVVISTLAIASLFTPLRRRLQATIDRQFYRRKYDAEQALEAFGHTLRDEVDLDNLTEVLLDVVQETMEPAFTACWLRKSDKAKS